MTTTEIPPFSNPAIPVSLQDNTEGTQRAFKGQAWDVGTGWIVRIQQGDAWLFVPKVDQPSASKFKLADVRIKGHLELVGVEVEGRIEPT